MSQHFGNITLNRIDVVVRDFVDLVNVVASCMDVVRVVALLVVHLLNLELCLVHNSRVDPLHSQLDLDYNNHHDPLDR